MPEKYSDEERADIYEALRKAQSEYQHRVRTEELLIVIELLRSFGVAAGLGNVYDYQTGAYEEAIFIRYTHAKVLHERLQELGLQRLIGEDTDHVD